MIRTLSITQQDRDALASIPHDPFIETPDDFDYSSVVIKKPWGHEYSIYKNRDVDVWFLFLKSGHKTSMHCHPHKKSTLTVIAGEARLATLAGTHSIKAGDAFVIDKGVFHSTEAISPDGIFLLESETPINKKNLVRFDDPYGRRGKRYESGESANFVNVRDDVAMPSFYGKEHGTGHRLGTSHVVLTRIEHGIGHDLLPSNAVAVILTGSLFTPEGTFGYGDVVDVDLFKQASTLSSPGSLDVLLIRQV